MRCAVSHRHAPSSPCRRIEMAHHQWPGAMDSGLAGLIAAETVLSHSDGARGILWVRGHTLAELVADFGYEGAVGLLWEGFAGDGLRRAAMRTRLGAGRELAFARLGDWLDPARVRPLVEGVRLALAA